MDEMVSRKTHFLPINMDFVSVKEYAENHGLADAPLPQRKNAIIKITPLLAALREQKDSKLRGNV